MWNEIKKFCVMYVYFNLWYYMTMIISGISGIIFLGLLFLGVDN